jgi:hypothetical protein
MDGLFINWVSHFCAGTVGGCLGVLAGHPFDTIKVRLQSQTIMKTSDSTKNGALYKNSFDCVKRILREEKIYGLFKGMTSPMIGVALVNAFLFSAYGSTLNLLGQDTKTPSYHAVWIAGAVSGALNTLVSCPLELAKIQMQNQLAEGRNLDPNFIKTERSITFRSPLNVLHNNYSLIGWRGVFMGFWSTFVRETPSYAVYFASYEYLCRLGSPTGRSGDIRGMPLLFIGAASGVLAWIISYPWDVLKTKIQAQRLITVDCYSQRKYRGWIQSWKICLKEEGWQSLFRGFGATIFRAIPTNAFIFFGFSTTMRLLQSIDLNEQRKTTSE